MKYSKAEILKHLFSLQHGKMNHGLSRTNTLLKKLSNPHEFFPIIHVAGTNGKGSICSLIASILQENGLKVGLYTSPHIIDFSERIRVNGKNISDADLAQSYSLIKNLSKKINASFFEITTAIAFYHFRNSFVDVAVVETGLGGKFDSTNVVEPILSIITTIDKDHCEILGENLIDIAKEKAGIIKNNSMVLIQDNQNIELLELFQKVAKQHSSELFFTFDFPKIDMQGFTEDLKMILTINLPDWEASNFLNQNLEAYNLLNPNSETYILIHQEQFPIKTNLLGIHQINNIRIAIFAALLISNKFDIKHAAIVNGIEKISENTGFKYRVECISKDPYLIIDVAHNPQSIHRLVQTITEVSNIKKWNFIFGAMKDKNIHKMLKSIHPICEQLIIVQPNIERAATTLSIKKIAQSIGFNNITVKKSIANAVKKITSPTVICGSFFTVSEAVQTMDLKDYTK